MSFFRKLFGKKKKVEEDAPKEWPFDYCSADDKKTKVNDELYDICNGVHVCSVIEKDPTNPLHSTVLMFCDKCNKYKVYDFNKILDELDDFLDNRSVHYIRYTCRDCGTIHDMWRVEFRDPDYIDPAFFDTYDRMWEYICEWNRTHNIQADNEIKQE